MKTNLKMNVLLLVLSCSFLSAVVVLTKQDLTVRKSCEADNRFYFHGRCF